MEIKLEQSQKQYLSQEMLQSVKILQMSSQELTEYVDRLALENPMLDLEREETDRILLSKLEWLANLDEQNRIYYQRDKNPDLKNILDIMAYENRETLADNLLAQLIGRNYSAEEHVIFEYIANSLDSKGFFTGTIEEIQERFGTGRRLVEECLETMKNLNPCGICSNNLEECLLKQLEKEPGDTSVEKTIVSQYLELLGKNYLGMIAKRMRVSVERVKKAKERIRTLNPKPGQGFSDNRMLQYINPDVIVIKLQGYFEIAVVDFPYAQFKLNKEYVKMLNDNRRCEKEVYEYLQQKYQEIQQISSNIEKRKTTLSKLTGYIVDKQKAFFINGKNYLRPLRMQEAAEALGVHESTISRAVREKYLQCCWGMFPLGYFFAKDACFGIGQDNRLTVDQMKDKIKNVLSEEDENRPLSDQKIAQILKENGIKISRRTVAKYRESMHVPDCRGRKLRR